MPRKHRLNYNARISVLQESTAQQQHNVRISSSTKATEASQADTAVFCCMYFYCTLRSVPPCMYWDLHIVSKGAYVRFCFV